MDRIIGFPNPVNEVAARVVAGGVVAMALLFLATRHPLVLVLLAYGFVARVASGPRFSPLGLLATRVIVPRLRTDARLVPGPPKRFAQAIGAVFSVSALVAYVLGSTATAVALIAALALAASLEAFVGFCLGCRIFAVLMRVGAIPDDVCAECNDISARLERAG
ncbi:MAG: DUF4395 domain-containing protein [Acidimicrobiales bacterium]